LEMLGLVDTNEQLAIASAVAGAAIGVATGPVGVVAGAGLSAAAQAKLQHVADQRRRRGEAVLIGAATKAEIEVDELIERLVRVDDGERLLVRVVLAAGNARSEERLLALSNALARAAISEAEVEADLGIVDAFAEVLDRMTDVQAVVLGAFTSTASSLGLAAIASETEPPFAPIETVMNALNAKQLEIVFADRLGPALTPAVAALQRLGLIEPLLSSGGALGGGGPSPTHYRITDFGKLVCAELEAARKALA